MARVTIVVLGDIGRSPRMQYHASSLIKEGYDVEIIGYSGSKLIKDIDNRVQIKAISEPPQFHNLRPKLIAYILKTIWQAITLLLSLLFKKHSDFVLVQTPPAIPTLAVCWLYCFIFRVTYIIDWHNYGFANMALTLGNKNMLVRISHWFEGFFGRKAKHNLCVTKAMKEDLQTRWCITATVLYDKPFDSFSFVETEIKHSFFKRISEQYPIFAGEDSANSTVFTLSLPNGVIALKQPRPALLISSTSWTEDEDFSLLLSALKVYDESKIQTIPNLICVITGKGPLKEHYINMINKYNWKRVKIITPWLEPEDYPVMLGAADLGVCLHMSTSGLDLPMKVVDMFGCGLPVVAYNFKALPELVHIGEYGTVFNDADELAKELLEWFEGFPQNKERFTKFRKNIEENFLKLRWHENWLCSASPLFNGVVIPLSKVSNIVNDGDKNK